MNETAELIAHYLAAQWEGFRAEPYLCPAGVPTIGYGFTRYPDGTLVTLRDPPMTKEVATSVLQHLIRTHYLPAVIRLCPGIETPEQIGAIADFAFNLGVGNLRSSTLRRKINSGDWDDVPAQLRRWTRANGRILRGLVLRREEEISYV